MSSASEIQISEALTLHRKGSVAQAKAVYESVLRQDARNANALGLLGIVAIQEADRSKAEALWTRSLAFPSKPLVYVRNLNNLVATLFEDGRDAEAVAVLENAVIPDWGAQPPDQWELKSIMSLALCLQRAGLTKRLRALLEPVTAHLANDEDAMRFLAAARFADADHAQALELLKTFGESDDLWILTTRLECAGELGRRQEAEAIRKRIVQNAPVYINEQFREDLQTVLVMNSSERILSTGSVFALHFNANFPTQLVDTLTGKFNFASLFPDGDYGRLGGIKPVIVLNNIVNAERLSRDDKQKSDLTFVAESFGVPVINHPAQAALTTRQRVVSWLKDVDNVRTPKTIRFEALANDIDIQIRLVEEKIGYPLIIRLTFTHYGVEVARVENWDELRRELYNRSGQQVYVHEFVDNRPKDRLFRKIRVAIVGDEIIPIWVDFDEYWNVSGRMKPEQKLFYRQRRHLLDLEKYIVREPNEILSTKVMQTMHEIRKRIPLDVFGIDFDVMPDGAVLFFEANATMNFFGLYSPDMADLARPEDASARVNDAITKYFLQIAAGATLLHPPRTGRLLDPAS